MMALAVPNTQCEYTNGRRCTWVVGVTPRTNHIANGRQNLLIDISSDTREFQWV